MTTPPEQPDRSSRPDADDALPESLRADLRSAIDGDGIELPSRVDERVLSASADHFAAFSSPLADQSEPSRELKPGVLAWITGRPLTTAGIGGGLLAASLAIAIIIGSPGQSGPSNGRTIALEESLPQDPAPAPMLMPDESAGRELATGGLAGGSGELDMRDGQFPEPATERGRAARRFDEPSSELETVLADALPEEVEMATLQGDVNGDGEVTIADALVFARAIERGDPPVSPGLDLVSDGQLTRADVDAVARLVVRLQPTPESPNTTEGAS